MVNKTKKGDTVSQEPAHTTFTSRGKLNGVLRQHPGGGSTQGGTTQPEREGNVDDLDTKTFEVLYYRARLILGDSLQRPGRFQIRGH